MQFSDMNKKNVTAFHLLQVGEVGQAAQAQVQGVLAGESDQPLGGTAKCQRVGEVDKVAGTMDPATREATTPVTPGAITLTKMTGNVCFGFIEILIIPVQKYCLQ